MSEPNTDADATSDPTTGPAAVCQQCREPVEPDATTCPHCQFEAGDDAPIRIAIYAIFGGLLLLTGPITIIGFPIGAFLWWRAWRHHKAHDSETVAVAPDAA